MPEVLLELIEILFSSGEGEDLLASIGPKITEFMGSKGTLLSNVIKGLTASEDAEFLDVVGDELHGRIKKAVDHQDQEVETIDCRKTSSWVESIEWTPNLHIAKLKVQGNPKIYKLPFFPKSILTLIKKGASPGKTMWRKYWRVFGKGKVSNKAKNFIRVEASKKLIRISNKSLPKLIVPKKTKKRTFNKNLIGRSLLKTSNIPNTGAKGIKITIKAPRIRKY